MSPKAVGVANSGRNDKGQGGLRPTPGIAVDQTQDTRVSMDSTANRWRGSHHPRVHRGTGHAPFESVHVPWWFEDQIHHRDVRRLRHTPFWIMA